MDAMRDIGTFLVVVLFIFTGVGVPWALYLDNQDKTNEAQENKSEGKD